MNAAEPTLQNKADGRSEAKKLLLATMRLTVLVLSVLLIV